MQRIPLTRVAAFSPFPGFLRRNGCEVSRYLSSCGIAAEGLASKESLVPLRLACEFVERVSTREGIDRFGLEVGSRASVCELGLFGKLLGRSLTLKDLMQKLVRWVPSLDSGARVWVESGQEDPACLRLCLRHEIDVGRPTIDAYGLLLCIDAVRLATGVDWRPKRVWLDAAAGDVARYEAFSEAEMERDVDYVAFEIPCALLGSPLSSDEPERASDSVPNEALQAGAPSEDFVESISQTIRAGFGIRVPKIEQVAEMAGMSTSTLQRRLRDEGLSYREMIDRTRFLEARLLLKDKSFSVSDIAWELGYSNTPNFTHAFLRWTGTTPLEYRRHRS